MRTPSTPSYPSRRRFLQSTAALAGVAAASTPGIATAGAHPGPRTARAPSLNSRIHLALIGCGSMGRANLAACAGQPDVVITVACDVWKERRDAVAAMHADTCRPMADFREVLEAADVDAVIIATPPHWHTLQAIAACEAGKDLYLQKPMTLHVGESLAVRNAVRRHGVMCQVGTQIHAGANYRRVVERIQAGHLGKIGAVRLFNVMNQGPEGIGRAPATPVPPGLDWDQWCGPAALCAYHPILARDAYHHGSWMAYSGGWTPGMAPHLLDLPVWALDLGFPEMTSSSGGRFVIQDDGDAYDHHEVLWRYPGLTVTWMSSLTNSFDFTSRTDAPPDRRLGMFFHGSDATLTTDYGAHRVVAEGKRMQSHNPPPARLEPSPGHEREWLDSIHSRRPPSCSPEYHVRVDVPIALSLLSLKLGRSIQFDPQRERILRDPEAARLAIPTYRRPWRFPAHYL